MHLFYSLSTGEVFLDSVPTPALGPHDLLVRSSVSLISPGTERMLIEFGRSSPLEKIKQQPDKFQQLLEKIRAEGLFSSLDAVRSKLDQPISLGYSNVGVVHAVGSSVRSFKPGDRVVSNGPHSTFVRVNQNLCAKVPSNVPDESAAFTVTASVGLQGIRLAAPTLGETFIVVGLGMIGLLTCQLLISNGCNVIAFDVSSDQCQLARSTGIQAFQFTTIESALSTLKIEHPLGVDGCLITASTSSSDPVHFAAHACRKRGRIVLIGVTGLELRRDLFYEKEISFQVSCSYGPGRYDENYEKLGADYPFGFVRWTEQRNFEAVLMALSNGAIRTDHLISHRFPFESSGEAYNLLTSPDPSLGIILQYSSTSDPISSNVTLRSEPPHSNHLTATSDPSLGVIGAGNYASRTLIPAFRTAGANLYALAASSGIRTVHLGRNYGFQRITSDAQSLLSDPACNTVVIATQHDSHAALVEQSLLAGKHVFVEKPLCITSDQLSVIQTAFSGQQVLMVGFNRRFAPLLVELKKHVDCLTGPKVFVYTCNAGAIPADHWTQDPDIGGGRLLGEACHFLDLLRYLAACPIKDISLYTASDNKPCPDTFSLQFCFEDGSLGTVHYLSNGSRSFPKERLEVFSSGKVLRLDNFRKLQAWGIPNFRTRRLLSPNKGQVACCASFLRSIQDGGTPPIPVSELFEVQRFLLQAVNA